MKLVSGLEDFWRYRRVWFLPGARRSFARQCKARRADPARLDSRPLAYVELTDPRSNGPKGRRLFLLFVMLERAGFHIVVRAHRGLFSDLETKRFKRMLLALPWQFWPPGQPLPEGVVQVVDRPQLVLPGARQQWRLQHEPAFDPTSAVVPMPFGMFPAHYVAGRDRAVARWRETRKSWRLFFAGGWDAANYDQPRLQTRYGVLSRYEILQRLARELPPERIRIVETRAELRALRAGYFNGFVWVRSPEVKLAGDEWFEMLAASDCFLGAPGTNWPMCHHLVEALSVGTPLLLEYADLVYPPETRENALIAFQGKAGLRAQLTALWAASPDTLASRRAAAIQAYEEGFRYDRFATRLLADPRKKIVIHTKPHERGSV